MVVYISSVSTFGKYRRIYWKKVRMKTQFSCKVFNIHKRLHKLWPEKISQQESKKGNMEVSPDKAPLMPSHGEWGIRSVKVLAILSHTAKIWHLLDSCSWLLYNSALVTSQLSISKISPYYLVLGQEKKTTISSTPAMWPPENTSFKFHDSLLLFPPRICYLAYKLVPNLQFWER